MVAKAKAKTPAPAKKSTEVKTAASEKREYKTAESAAKQKAQWEARGYKVTRKGNTLYIKKG
jgi:hypothetical protein